ncbi:hypothetical protein ACJX0J_042057, partial [Zea mays]
QHTKPTGSPCSHAGATGRRLDLDADDVRELAGFQSHVHQCVASRGLGLTAHIIDHYKLVLKFPEGTNSTWYNAQFKIFEPLEYKYDVCETVLLWEQLKGSHNCVRSVFWTRMMQVNHFLSLPKCLGFKPVSMFVSKLLTAVKLQYLSLL